MRRPLVALLVAAAVLAGCSPSTTQVIGQGADQVTIQRPKGGAHGAVILFLHGWGGLVPADYGPWLDHLTHEGHVVVFPRYQDSIHMPGEQALGHALAGIRAAFAQLGNVSDLVVVGHSAGGALAADYAAIAPSQGLPEPRAVLSIFPGRNAAAIPGTIPEVGDDRIPASTRLLVMASPDDTVVGTVTAHEIIDHAGHGDLLMVTTPNATAHVAPSLDTDAARRVFWGNLDVLLSQAG